MPTSICWAIIAAVGAATVLSFAILPEYFPKEMSARANAALNILHLSGAFALQYVTGVIVALWPTEAGHPPAEAYRTAISFGMFLQMAALLWFLIAARTAHVPVFRAMRTTARMARVPRRGATTDYVNAQLVLARHVAHARSQATHWRRLGLASAALCLCLGTTLAIAAQSHVFAYVVVTPANSMALDLGVEEPTPLRSFADLPIPVAGILIAEPIPWPAIGAITARPVTLAVGTEPWNMRVEAKRASYSQGP